MTIAATHAPLKSSILARVANRFRRMLAGDPAAREHAALMNKFAHHADPRSFNWNWKSVNYNRVALVNLLVSKFGDPDYLEIGCAWNVLFDAVPATNKVGVDPERGGTERTTSDEFFARNRQKFDVIFIDGLHTYEQVREDVINALKCVKDGGWIALHDMLPGNWIDQHVPKLSLGAWNGDVWKVAFELATTEGIDFRILKIDNGVGVFKMKRSNVTLNDRKAELERREFGYFADNLKQLPVMDWKDAQSWLRNS
jgi:hypothetical protein